MALTKERKEEIVEAYAERLSRSNVAIWANYRGVKAQQFETLRNTLRPSNAEMMVVKNTLMRVALEQHDPGRRHVERQAHHGRDEQALHPVVHHDGVDDGDEGAGGTADLYP